jgi:hypothetical protein
MPPLPHILARSGEDSFIKILFGIIVLVIWLGGALMSALQKRAEEAKRRARYNQMPTGYTRPVPPVPANPAGFPTPPPPKAKSKRAAKRQNLGKPLPSAPAPAIVRPTLATAPPTPATTRATPAPTAQPSQIARLLRRPDSLRAALILNEVLSPPVALRDRIDSGQSV